MPQDIKLYQDINGIWTFDFEKGDFQKTNGIDTALYMSVFGEARADEVDIKEPLQRRGHFLDAIRTLEIGNRAWIQYSKNLNQETLNNIKGEIESGLQWLLDGNIVDNITVEIEYINNNIAINITLRSSQGSENYNLLLNTV